MFPFTQDPDVKRFLCTALMALSLLGVAHAQEATIRKNLTERLPNLPRIDDISKAPMPGLWEVRINGSEIFYTDGEGNFILQGSLIDTRTRTDLTEQRINQLSAVAFKDLPLKDAFVITKGKGTRQLAVFEDPNCGFCKRLHREFAKLDNVSIHIFLLPVLGPDSLEKSRNAWCAKDRTRVYLDWMLNNAPIPKASCDTAAIDRNIALGRQLAIRGTPALVFANGQRVPGYIPAERIEALLAETKTP